MGCACGCHTTPAQISVSVQELTKFIYESNQPEIAWSDATDDDKKKSADLAAALLAKYIITDDSVTRLMQVPVTTFKPETIIS